MNEPAHLRVIDAATGHEYTVAASVVETNPDAFSTVFDADDSEHPAYDVNGEPAGAVFNIPDAAGRYTGLLVEQLRAELADRGLPTDGNKPDLVDRLVADDTKEN
ncbi:SAP domain-containing protein [Nocardioides marmoraquaticus]